MAVAETAVMSMAAVETAVMGMAAEAHGGGAAVAACISTRGVQQSARARQSAREV